MIFEKKKCSSRKSGSPVVKLKWPSGHLASIWPSGHLAIPGIQLPHSASNPHLRDHQSMPSYCSPRMAPGVRVHACMDTRTHNNVSSSVGLAPSHRPPSACQPHRRDSSHKYYCRVLRPHQSGLARAPPRMAPGVHVHATRGPEIGT